MGFMDKVKAQAQQVAQQAQQGIAQGQSKLDEMQARKQADALLRDLGAAYYAEQRTGGGSDEVLAALRKIDAHVANNGPIDTGATAPTPAATVGEATPHPPAPTSAEGAPPAHPSTGAQPPTQPPNQPPNQPPGGNFSLDDL